MPQRVPTGVLFPAAISQTAGPAAWQNDLTPIAASDWNYEFAAHLLERAGFGGTPDEIQALAKMTPAQAVARLVRFEGAAASHLPPFDHSGIHDPGLEPFPPSRPAVTDWPRKRRSSRHQGQARGQPPPSADRRRILLLAARQRCSKPTASPTGGRTACSPAPGRCRKKWRSSGTAISSPTKPRSATTANFSTSWNCSKTRAPAISAISRSAVAQDPGHALVSRCRRQRQGRFQRKFRARNHGAVHHGRGPLHGEGYPRGRPRVHRLELRGCEIRRQQRPA